MADRAAQIQEAQQLFMFGPPGSNEPIRVVSELVQRTGLSPTTINSLLPAWKADLLARAGAMSAVYGNASNPDVLAAHEDDVAFIRRQMDSAKAKAIQALENAGGDVLSSTYVAALEQFLELKKTWDRWEGVTAAIGMAGKARELAIEEMVKASPKARAVSGRDVTEDPAFADSDSIDMIE